MAWNIKIVIKKEKIANFLENDPFVPLYKGLSEYASFDFVGHKKHQENAKQISCMM